MCPFIIYPLIFCPQNRSYIFITINVISDFDIFFLKIRRTWNRQISEFYLILCNMYVWVPGLTSKIIRITMIRKHGRKTQSKMSNVFNASRVIKVAALAFIFYISSFIVLVIMFLLQKETNLDVVAIRSHVKVINTSNPLHTNSANSFSVSFTYV